MAVIAARVPSSPLTGVAEKPGLVALDQEGTVTAVQFAEDEHEIGDLAERCPHLRPVQDVRVLVDHGRGFDGRGVTAGAGSVRPNAPITSPVASRGNHFFF